MSRLDPEGVNHRTVRSERRYFPAWDGVTVKNHGPGTVYYGGASVTTSSYTGTISSGASVDLTVGYYYVSASESRLSLDYETTLEYLQGQISEIEGTDLSAIEADIAVIGETVNLADGTGVNQAQTLQVALDAVEDAGGGVVRVGPTDRTGTGFSLDGPVTVGMATDLRGTGKRGTLFTCTDATAGITFLGAFDTGYSGSTNRGGRSGGFHIDGDDLATNPLVVNAVANRMFEDIRVSTPADNGTALLLDGAQNTNWINFEAEDTAHTSSRTVIGILLDGAASGNNFNGTSLNEFTNGHVVFDASYDASATLGIDHSNNNVFVGNMIERSDTYNPIIHLKAGTNNHFIGGNITSGGSADGSLAAEYDLVLFDNTAARSLSTGSGGTSASYNLTFSRINFTGTLGAASAKFANAFHIESDVTSWHQHIVVDPSCTYSNCKYLAQLDSGSCVLLAPHQDNASTGGLSAGWSNPTGAGKVNTRIQASANTITTKAQVSYYELTGNTTLNTLSASYSGHQIVLKFAGTPTVSSSAGNIKLSGLVDMSATADDLLCLICDGTNWHETSRVVK